MKLPLLFMLFGLFASTAAADTKRFKLRGSTGELVDTGKPCGKVVRAQLWDIIFKTPKIEIVDDVMRGATKSLKGNPFVGTFLVSFATITVAITLPKPDQRHVPTTVELSYVTSAGACSEKWLGLAEVW